MSQKLINLNKDLKRLHDEGYFIQIRGGLLAVPRKPHRNKCNTLSTARNASHCRGGKREFRLVNAGRDRRPADDHRTGYVMNNWRKGGSTGRRPLLSIRACELWP